MKRWITLFFVVMGLCYCLNAQDYKVVSVEHLSNDFSARDEMMTDEKGRQCAVLRIATKDLTSEQRNGFFFECDFASYVVERRIMDGEIWLWVSPGLKTLKITHKDLGRYELHMTTTGVGTIQPLNVYKVLIQGTFKAGPEVKAKPKRQYLAFQITPANATLEVNDRIWEVDADGIAQEYVDFGTYTWRVQALNYHTEAGMVTVDDPDNTKFVTVTLNPNYGWIEVDGKGDLRDASVYVDNILIGKAPCKSDALKSGQHSVRIAKKMFDSYSETVTVRDNETTRLAPALKADYAEVTLKVDGDAEIWVNDELKAVGSWKGQLGRGVYKMECKKANHETSLTSQEITPAMNGQTINLPAPNPIYGSLMVESIPRICQLYIDGKDMGTTPKSINEILIGQHELKLTKEGYADYTEKVNIAKGENKQVKATLSNGREIQFTCNVPNVTLEIDGQRVSSANGSYMLTFGNHSLKATAADYRDYTATLNVTENSRSHNIVMEKILVGAISGIFSVSAEKKVYFSQGNLQYQASTNTWRFAEHQYDYIGEANNNISSSYSGWIDLFGWGTSGWNSGAVCYQPWNTSTSYSDYNPGGSYTNNLHGSCAKADWGVYNAISNGGNTANTWRTLTKDEWVYVFNTRSTSSGIRYAKACVNSVNGVILLPDDWSTSTYSLSNTNSSGANYTANTITATQWATLEQHGAVFLPAAGHRYGTSVSYVGSYGSYWSASCYNENYAFSVWFFSDRLSPQGYDYRYNGLSVRLVRSAQ